MYLTTWQVIVEEVPVRPEGADGGVVAEQVEDERQRKLEPVGLI